MPESATPPKGATDGSWSVGIGGAFATNVSLMRIVVVVALDLLMSCQLCIMTGFFGTKLAGEPRIRLTSSAPYPKTGLAITRNGSLGSLMHLPLWMSRHDDTVWQWPRGRSEMSELSGQAVFPLSVVWCCETRPQW